MTVKKKSVKKKVTAKPVVKKAVLQDWTPGKLRAVKTRIGRDAGFEPTPGEHGCVELRANVPADVSGQRRVALPHRASSFVDCGLSIEVPEGYRAVLKINEDLAKKGVLVANTPAYHTSGRVRVQIINLGRETIVVNHLDKVAQMTVEPIYAFEWETVEEAK